LNIKTVLKFLFLFAFSVYSLEAAITGEKLFSILDPSISRIIYIILFVLDIMVLTDMLNDIEKSK